MSRLLPKASLNRRNCWHSSLYKMHDAMFLGELSMASTDANAHLSKGSAFGSCSMLLQSPPGISSLNRPPKKEGKDISQ